MTQEKRVYHKSTLLKLAHSTFKMDSKQKTSESIEQPAVSTDTCEGTEGKAVFWSLDANLINRDPSATSLKSYPGNKPFKKKKLPKVSKSHNSAGGFKRPTFLFDDCAQSRSASYLLSMVDTKAEGKTKSKRKAKKDCTTVKALPFVK
mmetsp:Transcript_10010/g.21879  ORF Transcript_10010/g.21879 Transcript_10010/m.21879 type:complete len:148 (-) Transcript_10010:516-959(-)